MRRRPTRSKNVPTLAHLQEQVTLLTTENERLKTILAEHGLNNILTSNTRTQNEENVENKPRGSLAGLSTPNTPKSKGCSCRGNCATRVCGCVKKNVPCAEFCRCGDELCQNQEPDKENIGDPNNQAKLSKDGEDSLKKLSQLSLNDKIELKQEKTASAAPLNKQIEKIVKKPGLFSPGPSNNIANIDNNEYVNRTLRFGDETDSDEIFDKNDENAKKLVEPTNKEKRETKNVASTEKEMKKSTKRVETTKKETKNMTTTRKETNNDEPSKNGPGRSRRQNLKLPEPQKKGRSLSNNDEETESNVVKKKSTKRSLSVDERVLKRSNDKPGKTLAVLMNGLKPFRRAAKVGKSRKISSDETDSENNAIEPMIEEPKKKDKTSKRKKQSKNAKSKKNDENIRQNPNEMEEASNIIETETRKETNKMVDKKREKKTVSVEKEEEEEEEEKDNGEVNVKYHKWNTVEQKTVVKIEDKVDEINDNVEQPNLEQPNVEQPNEENVIETSHDSGNSEPSTSAMSPNSDVASGNNFLQPEENAEFDPMKPRHKLSRSPIVPRNDTRYYQSLDISERPLPPPIVEDPIIELPPPEELSEAIVDWDKHQAALVFCSKCKRRFYEYRIKKHEANCHNV